MQKSIIVLSIVLSLGIAGCAFMAKVAPSQMDESGNVIPGTHELSPLAKDTAQAIPYGEVVVGIGLLVWNFVERVKRNKTTSGLVATMRAIETASKEPGTTESITRLKQLLAENHKGANVQPLINRLLAQIKYPILKG